MFLKRVLTIGLFASLAGGAANAATVSASFGPAYDFDDGPGSVQMTLAGLDPAITSALTIDFTVIGDLDAKAENFTLSVDGTAFGIGCDQNVGNDTFGILADDCYQSSDGFVDGLLVIDETTAADLLTDGALTITFDFTYSVNNFVDITAPTSRSGVVFDTTANIAFAAGGTISYEGIAPVSLPAGMPLMVGTLGALGLVSRRKRRG